MGECVERKLGHYGVILVQHTQAGHFAHYPLNALQNLVPLLLPLLLLHRLVNLEEQLPEAPVRHLVAQMELLFELGEEEMLGQVALEVEVAEEHEVIGEAPAVVDELGFPQRPNIGQAAPRLSPARLHPVQTLAQQKEVEREDADVNVVVPYQLEELLPELLRLNAGYRFPPQLLPEIILGHVFSLVQLE
eukprot:CAMPEP_0168623310 /NCGR_PEP_ID=MMETSP0449_2-20121227/8752_1 /TAXON_ID=1082188 /ORGANISM="Strombidium rassoulzadegani, Strain ras09" /LENGTH=189 /DNA_ID=CAMNT_0008664673 /DNA_START=21 /DNA_END=590 /DNA_ORIENTATION=-